MQVLLKVSVIFPDTQDFINGKLGAERGKEYISVEGVIYVSLLCLCIANESFFYIKSSCFQLYFDLEFAMQKRDPQTTSLEKNNQHSKHSPLQGVKI